MSILTSQVDTAASDYSANYDHNLTLSKNLAELAGQISAGGSEQARDRHTQRGKLLVRDRIDGFLREGRQACGSGGAI